MFDFAGEYMMRWAKDGIYKWVRTKFPQGQPGPNLGGVRPNSGSLCSIRMTESTSGLVGIVKVIRPVGGRQVCSSKTTLSEPFSTAFSRTSLSLALKGLPRV